MEDQYDYRSLLELELFRLHKMIQQGTRVEWATQEISRIYRILFTPPMISNEDGSFSYMSSEFQGGEK